MKNDRIKEIFTELQNTEASSDKNKRTLINKSRKLVPAPLKTKSFKAGTKAILYNPYFNDLKELNKEHITFILLHEEAHLSRYPLKQNALFNLFILFLSIAVISYYVPFYILNMGGIYPISTFIIFLAIALISPKFTYKGNWDIESKCDLWAAKMMKEACNIKNPWDVAFEALEIIDGIDYEATLSQSTNKMEGDIGFKIKKRVVKAYFNFLGIQFHPTNQERRVYLKDNTDRDDI